MDQQSRGWRVRVCLQGRLGRAFGLSQNRRDACLSLVSLDTTHAVRNELNLPSSWLHRYPKGKPATTCCSGPSVRFAPHLYQQQTGLLQAARTWCQLLRVRVAAVSSVCVLPRHRCRDRGWDRGRRTRLISVGCNTQELRCSLVSASRWSCAVVRTGCQPKIRAH